MAKTPARLVWKGRRPLAVSADEEKQMVQGPSRDRAAAPILPGDAVELPVLALQLDDLVLEQYLDIGLCGDPLAQVARHRGLERAAAHYHPHLGGVG